MVVATIAFGIGIDCTDVKEVVHIGMLDDIDGYIQELEELGIPSLLFYSILKKEGNVLLSWTT